MFSELHLDVSFHSLQLLLQLLIVGPGRAEVLVTIVCIIQTFGLFLFLMIIRKHFFMFFLANDWLALWCTTASLGDFDDHLRLLVLAKIVRKDLAVLQLFVDAPEHRFRDREVITAM